MKIWDFAVIGAGSAGRSAAEYLAEKAPGRSILLIDDEGVLPYKRTQVSKNVDRGFELDEFRIHDELWYAGNGIELRTGEVVKEIDTGRHTLVLDTGSVGYGQLLMATGAAPLDPFRQAGSRLLSHLWDVRDGNRLHHQLSGRREVAIIGNGVLGIEAAWQCSRMDVPVTIYGRNSRPLSKYLDEPCASTLTDSIRKAGIACRTGFDVIGITEGPEGVTVHTDEGGYPADFAIIAAGSRPRTALAKASGIAVNRGIIVDRSLRTSAEDVRAAGDCAEHPDGSITGLWHSAEHQGRLAAEGMLGGDVENHNPPYRLKCEVFGGFWFSAGPVHQDAESWRFGTDIWRVSFRSGSLEALCGGAPGGLDKKSAKAAQDLVLQGTDRDETYSVLSGFYS